MEENDGPKLLWNREQLYWFFSKAVHTEWPSKQLIKKLHTQPGEQLNFCDKYDPCLVIVTKGEKG